jgi:hypothetical protein
MGIDRSQVELNSDPVTEVARMGPGESFSTFRGLMVAVTIGLTLWVGVALVLWAL